MKMMTTEQKAQFIKEMAQRRAVLFDKWITAVQGRDVEGSRKIGQQMNDVMGSVAMMLDRDPQGLEFDNWAGMVENDRTWITLIDELENGRPAAVKTVEVGWFNIVTRKLRYDSEGRAYVKISGNRVYVRFDEKNQCYDPCMKVQADTREDAE